MFQFSWKWYMWEHLNYAFHTFKYDFKFWFGYLIHKISGWLIKLFLFIHINIVFDWSNRYQTTEFPKKVMCKISRMQNDCLDFQLLKALVCLLFTVVCLYWWGEDESEEWGGSSKRKVKKWLIWNNSEVFFYRIEMMNNLTRQYSDAFCNMPRWVKM